MKRQCGKLGDSDLLLYLADPDDASLSALRSHLATCSECAEELRAWRSLQGELAAHLEGDEDDHPSAERLAVFADHADSLGVAMRTEIEAHLSMCAACRDEIRVLGAVRIERAAAAEQGEAAVASLEALRARVAQRTERPQRRRLGLLALAAVLLVALVVVGLIVLERGVDLLPLPEPISEGLRRFAPQDARDGLRQTARADAYRGDRPPAASAKVPPPPAVGRPVFSAPPLRTSPAAGKAPAVAATEPDTDVVADTGTHGAVDPAAAAVMERRVARDSAQDSAQHPAEDSAEDPAEDLPTASSTREVLSPEELIARLAAQTAEADVEGGERKGAPSPGATPSGVSGAAVFELPATDDGAATHSAEQDDEQGLETAEVPAESMIVGVRELGAVPTLRLPGAGAPAEQSAEGLEPPPAGDSGQDSARAWVAATRPARVLFGRGSSYVFTTGEVAAGVELQFALPLLEEQAQDVDMRVRELGSERELRESFAAPADPLQVSPLETLRVPAGWLRPGRYSVELSAPDIEGFEVQSLNLRIVEGD
jgi:hypothetical protein